MSATAAKPATPDQLPDPTGHFGRYGGVFVPETLMTALAELTAAYEQARDDPAFQAGYPKTPVFDGGCRPAELFLVLAGGRYSPAAYKAGLFACLLLIPLVFVAAARGVGLPAGAAVLAGAGGLVLGWSGPVRLLIEEGDLDFLAAGLAAIVFVSWLARYSKWFGIDSCLVLAGVATVTLLG